MTENQRRSIQVVGVVLVDSERVLIVRRPPHDTGAGFWEFPGGKIEVGESPEQALHREVEEELAIRIRIDARLGRYVHAYPNVDIDLTLFAATQTGGALELREHDAFEWVGIDEVDPSRLLEADRPFVGLIRDYLRTRKIT